MFFLACSHVFHSFHIVQFKHVSCWWHMRLVPCGAMFDSFLHAFVDAIGIKWTKREWQKPTQCVHDINWPFLIQTCSKFQKCPLNACWQLLTHNEQLLMQCKSWCCRQNSSAMCFSTTTHDKWQFFTAKRSQTRDAISNDNALKQSLLLQCFAEETNYGCTNKKLMSVTMSCLFVPCSSSSLTRLPISLARLITRCASFDHCSLHCHHMSIKTCNIMTEQNRFMCFHPNVPLGFCICSFGCTLVLSLELGSWLDLWGWTTGKITLLSHMLITQN